MTDIIYDKNNTEEIRKQGLDKFYTKPEIVDICIKSISTIYDWKEWDMVIEPSAGNGSFLTKIPVTKDKLLGIDICPDIIENNINELQIITRDFLTYEIDQYKQFVLVIGNPPFGRVSSLAIKFFNHAATFASVIAFIIPKTFRRISVQNKLNKHFHLIHDENIPMKPCSFNPPMNVKCCYQIWEFRDIIREEIKLTCVHDDWTFLSFGPKDDKKQPTVPPNADFAIRAYGGKCGEIARELTKLRPKSWHWIKAKIPIEELIHRFTQLDYSQSTNTARQNSIGKGDLVTLYLEKYQED